MKPNLGGLLAAAPLLVVFASPSSAAEVIKADNSDNLDQASSWSGGVVPGVDDVALWDSTVTGASSTLLGSDLGWSGIRILDPVGNVSIGAGSELTLGADGIDMSAAVQDLTISSDFVLDQAQTWNVASGRMLNFNTGTFTRSAGATLNLQGAGTVAASNISNVNDIVGPWASVGSGTSLSYASVNGSGELVGYTGAMDISGLSMGGTSATSSYDLQGNNNAHAFGGSRSLNTIRLEGAGARLTSGASDRTLTANGIMNSSSGTFLINNSNGALFLAVGSTGELVVTTNDQNIDIYSAINNGSNENGSLTFNSTGGQLTLIGANSYTGATVINGGTLYANIGNGPNNKVFSTTSGITVNEGATLRSSSNALFGWDGSQEKPITVNAGGTITTNGGLLSDVGVGLVTLNGGTLASLAGGAIDWGSWRFDQASDKLRVTEDSEASAENVKFQNGGSIEVDSDKTLTFSGTITDSSNGGVSSVVKEGAGTMLVTGNHSYTGATTINAGTLKIGDGGTAGSISGFSGVTNNATLEYDRSDSLSASYAITGTGSVVKKGTGTLFLTSSSSDYSGGTSIEGGKLALDAELATLGSGAVTLANGAILQMHRGDASDNLSYGTEFANELHIAEGESGAFYNMARGDWSGPLTGSGTLNLRVNATRGEVTGDWSAFTGQVNVTTRTGNDDFRVGGGSVGLDMPGAALDLAAGVNLYQSANPPSSGDLTTDHFIGELSGAAGSNIGGNPVGGRFTNWTVGALDTDSTFAGTIADSAGAARLTKVGTGRLTLSGANSYTGATAVNGGTLLINGDQSAATGAVTVAGGATLGGSGTVGGDTTFEDGATHAVGNSPGLQTFNGTVNYNQNSIFEWELVDNTTANRGSDWDAVNGSSSHDLNVNSNAVFNIILDGSDNGGTSAVDFADTFWAAPGGQSWEVFSGFQSVAGLFTLGTITVDSNDQGYATYGSFSLSSGSGSLSLNWTPVPEPTTALAGLLLGAGLLRRRRGEG